MPLEKTFSQKNCVMSAFTAARGRLARKHGACVDERAYKLNISPKKLKDKSIKKTATAGRNNALIANKISDAWKLVAVKDTSRDVARKALVTEILLLADHKKKRVLIKDIGKNVDDDLLDQIWTSGANTFLSQKAEALYKKLEKHPLRVKAKTARKPR